MRSFIFVVVFICPPFLKGYVLRWFSGARIGRHVRIGWFSAVMGRQIELGDFSEVRALTLIRCDGGVRISRYCVISNFVLVYGSASFIVGDHCYVGPQCLINADEDVRIGKGSALGPRCMIFTHGSFLPYTEGYWVKFSGVTIGDHVWIAAGVFIHSGVEVGSDVFVNSRSVLTRDVPAGEVVEGFPAVRVAGMAQLRRNMSPERLDAASSQMLERFRDVVLRRRWGIELGANTANRLDFRYRNREYLMLYVPSNAAMPELGEKDHDKRCIFLVNRAHWLPPAAVKNPVIFDLTAMKTQWSRDKVAGELWRFMRTYFGVTFEYQ